jgi:ferredoxin
MAVRVLFHGAGREASAEQGAVLLDVAHGAGVHIDSTCGGNGSCHQCRVTVDNPDALTGRDGKPADPPYTSNGEAVFLACRVRVQADVGVTPAPLHGFSGDTEDRGLAGWCVPGAGGVSVLDLGTVTGALYRLDDRGVFGPAAAFSLESGVPEAGPGRCVRVGRDVPRSDALARGVEHLGAGPVLVFDLAGYVAVVADGKAELEPVPTMALLGEAPHLPGAVRYVDWSPLKTRTILGTVGDVAPTGLCASGVLACVAAIRRAGMCDADWRLVESRFTRPAGDGLEAVLVGPQDEAVTPGGAILNADTDIVFTQMMLDDARHVLENLRVMALHLLAGREPSAVVLTGEHGTIATPETLDALELWPQTPTAQPHIAALGAARASLG